MFTCRSSTLTILADSGSFRALLLTLLWSQSDLHDWRSPGCVYVSVVNTHCFVQFWPILGARRDFHSCWTPRCAYVLVINTHNFDRFWPISWTITHCFGVLVWFPQLTNFGVRLRAVHQNSRFLSILTRFVDYYSPFCGPKAISMVVKPQGALKCMSSTITIWPVS